MDKKKFNTSAFEDGKRIRAFTLLELLMVMAITGILMAILLVTISQVRERAKSATCTSNLAQIGQAALLWSADHKGEMVPCNQDTNGAAFWPALLAQYIGAEFELNNPNKQPSIYCCPSAAANFTDAEKNAYFVSYRANIAGASQGANFYHPKYTTLKLASISNPSGFPLIVDGAPRAPNNWRGWFGTSQGDKDLIGFFHGSKAHRVFLDGHVDSAALAGWTPMSAENWKALGFSGSPPSY